VLEVGSISYFFEASFEGVPALALLKDELKLPAEKSEQDEVPWSN
jgi:hypothetical protein